MATRSPPFNNRSLRWTGITLVASMSILCRLSALPALPLAAIVGACSTDVALHGNLPPAYQVAEIHPGKTTAQEVVKILGSPSSTGVFDHNQWYYISDRTSRLAFFTPKVLSQDVYVVDFDGNGVVKAVEHKNMKSAKEVSPAPGETPAPGQHLSFIQQLIGNIGRFNGVETTGSSGP
jgi:outer membrane protein assembly factor BamE (lipoprotein component of BamABCDE complex)